MEMYELSDRTAERDLAAAASGVRVRVLLDKAFSGAEVNRSAVHYLDARGVKVRWAPAGYIFHIKATTFDAKTSDISSANLVSKSYRGTPGRGSHRQQSSTRALRSSAPFQTTGQPGRSAAPELRPSRPRGWSGHPTASRGQRRPPSSTRSEQRATPSTSNPKSSLVPPSTERSPPPRAARCAAGSS